MRPLLAISAAIDQVNEKIGYVCNFLVLAACLVSAGNAMIRYAFGYSSNGWLELQWYMFAILVMFGASYTFKRNEHVRVEIFYLFLSERGQLWLDLIGTLFFLIPSCLLLGYLSWPFFHQAYAVGEMSGNAGGLVRWPIKFVIPVRLRDAGVARRLGSDQAHRRAAGRGDDRREVREADAMITLEMMPPLMFGGLVVAMLIGFPVAFTLAAVGLSFGFLAIHLGFFDLNFLQAIPGRVFGSVLSNELLLAIPFFTFMGAILERCGLAEDMLDSMGQLFGPIRGGLGYSVILVGFILGAITGTVAAQVIAMALISMPVMIRYGYNIRYITGVLAASGTITQLVPPSLVLIVLADQLGKSVGDMYLGAWGPSIFQILLFAGYTFVLGIFKPDHVPPVPKTELDADRMAAVAQMPARHHPVGGADLRRARHHDDGARDADRSRRHGRGRRDRAGGDPQQGFQHHRPQDSDHRRDRRRHRHHRRHLHDRGADLQDRLCHHLSRGGVDLPRGGSDSRTARSDQAGLRDHHAHHHHGGVHPDRLDLLLGGVPRRLRRRLAGAPADVAARRRLGLPDLHQPLHLLPGVLPGFLRDRLHHPADDRADRAEDPGAGGRARMPR